MLDCIVVGAGPGGIVSTKELIEQGIDNIVCLEKSQSLGGLFTDTYDNLVLTSSATISMYSDFWIGDGNQHRFWTKEEAVEYWQKYAEHFNVINYIRFNSEVVSVSWQDNDCWKLDLKSGESFYSKRIALAIGNNNIPSYPKWKDFLTNIEYSHAKNYRNSDPFKGKNVLVVGGGESGSDIALEIAEVANQCWVSLRNSTGWVAPRKRGVRAADISTHRGVWGLPRDYGKVLSKDVEKAELLQNDPVHDTVVELNRKVKAEKGIWGTFGTKTFALPKAIVHYGCEVVGEIVEVEKGGRTLRTKEGDVLENVDAVVFSTGYKNFVSFLPKQLQSTDPRKLYKHMFHPGYGDRLAWIGWARPNFGSQFPVMEMQARLFALVCKGEVNIPKPPEMERIASIDAAQNIEQFEHNAYRVRSLVDYFHYMDDLAKMMGCYPPLWKYFFLHPRVWLRIVYGAAQATQYRLQGPGKKEKLAREYLMRLPVSKPTHIVKSGLKGRLLYAFGGMVFNLANVVKRFRNANPSLREQSDFQSRILNRS